MLSGFNTNLRHRGVLFHVQTEDSGRANPHIISHLFHGGNILVSRKCEYADRLEADDSQKIVREMMEQQHKELLRSLVRGQCDEQIIARLGPQAFGDATAGSEVGVLDSSTEEAEVELIEAEVDAFFADPVAADAPVAEPAKERIARAFGDGVVSHKPLDEVVLDYLVESARKRKRPSS